MDVHILRRLAKNFEVASPIISCSEILQWWIKHNLHFKAEGISNNLANYMTMALDPNVGHLVKYMNREVPAYGQLLDQLQQELDVKLIHSKMSVLDLFHKVAIR